MKCRIWVSEKQISRFRKGLEATATWHGTTLTGHVDQVDMSINSSRQAFGVILKFANPDQAMQCGVTARVKVATYESEGSLSTERKNILTEQAKTYVYVVSDDTAKKCFVTTGKTSGLDVEILDGLRSGDLLIVEGQTQVEDGTKIHLIEEETSIAQNSTVDAQ